MRRFWGLAPLRALEFRVFLEGSCALLLYSAHALWRHLRRRLPHFSSYMGVFFVVLYCNFRSLAFLGFLGFLIRQLKIKFIATFLSAAK